MQARPLAGINVVDLSSLLPGPFLTQCLAQLGADVVKYERPGGDLVRRMRPGSYVVLNGAKQVRTADLAVKADRDEVLREIAAADVVVEGNRPGVAARIGLDYPSLARSNPRLVYVSLSGYGQAGPLSQLPGHEINYMAASGLLALSGNLTYGMEGAAGVPLGDYISSLYALSATLAALFERSATGRGQYLDVSMTDALIHVMGATMGHFQGSGLTDLTTQRKAVLCKAAYGVFETMDGEWLALGSLEDKFWSATVSALDLEVSDLAVDTARERSRIAEEINRRLASRIAHVRLDELLDRLARANVPASRVVPPHEVLDTEHARVRELTSVVDGIRTVAFPVRMRHG